MFLVPAAIQIGQEFKFFNYLDIMCRAKEQQHGYPQKEAVLMSKFFRMINQAGTNGILQRAPAMSDPLVDTAYDLAVQVVKYYYENGPRPERWEEMGPWFALDQPLEHK